ncbi:MAG: TRAP transporter small permease subunit [Pseudomonadota bacterium]
MSADSQVGAASAGMMMEPAPAVSARIFGWTMIALMVAFLTNVVLTFWFAMPGIGPLLGWNANGAPSVGLSVFQAAIYVAAIVIAFFWVNKTSARTLRDDERLVSDLNALFIRACFWIVVLVGLTDAVISFMRVEGMLEAYFGEQLASDLGKSRFRGPYVHIPCAILGILIAFFNKNLGFHWLALLVVLAELMIVFSRFVFSYEQAFMADLVRFWYGALFLFASAYTLLDDGHVRVDLLYASFKRQTKGAINKWGAIFLGIPLCWTILLIGMWSKSSVIVSPVLVFEVTQAGFGLYIKYFMAAFLGVFAISMLLQFVSQFFGAVSDRRGEAGARETGDIAH